MATGRLDHGPRRPDRWPGRLDAVLAGTALAGGLVLLSIGSYNTIYPPERTSRAVYLLPLTAVCAAVLLRRSATRTGLAIGTAAAVADVALGGSLGTLLVYTQVLYDACVYGSDRLWRWLLRISVAATVLGGAAGVVLAHAWRGVGVGMVFALIGVLPVVTGVSVRQYRDQAATERARAAAERARAAAERARAEVERERAEQTARLAELDRHLAVAAERARMARELHDVVANHLSAVAIHATAALSLRDLDAAGVRRALTVIRSSGVQGLAEMRRMIELLRDADGRPDEPGRAGIDQLDGLLERAREAGLDVAVEIGGAPRPLPTSVDLAAYRIAQESLTNALKHGGTGTTLVRVDYLPDRLSLTINSPLRPRVKSAAGPAGTGGPAGMGGGAGAGRGNGAGGANGTGSPAGTGGGAGAGAANGAGGANGTGGGAGAGGANGAGGVNGAGGPNGTGSAHGVAVLPGAGAGLLGMRERVELLAGRFSAGRAESGAPRPGTEATGCLPPDAMGDFPPDGGRGRWLVRADLPTGPAGDLPGGAP